MTTRRKVGSKQSRISYHHHISSSASSGIIANDTRARALVRVRRIGALWVVAAMVDFCFANQERCFFFFFDKRIRIKGERSRLPLPSPPTEYGVDRTRETCFADIHVYYVQQPAPFRSRSQTRLELVMKTDTHTHTHTHTQGKKKGGEGGGTREERGVGGKGFGRILKNLHFILFLFLFPV